MGALLRPDVGRLAALTDTAGAAAKPSPWQGRRRASTSTNAGPVSKLDPASIRQHTLALVQKHNYANYLITSFYPDSESRYDYAAIRAFNIPGLALCNAAAEVADLPPHPDHRC